MTRLLPFAPARPRSPSADLAFDALPRLRQLRDALQTARPQPSRWGEPAVFFFDPARQAALDAARPKAADPIAELVATELPQLLESVEVRRVARGVVGLREAAAQVPAAKPLAELLAVPDDETVLVLHPAARAGVRVAVRGVADVFAFHVLLADVAGDVFNLPRPSVRLVDACSADSLDPAETSLVAESPVQMFRPSALQPDGTLPSGFRGSDHWVWGTQPLASVPRIDGERVVLLGEPAFKQTWEVDRRFPGMRASVRRLGVLSSSAVAAQLAKLAGQPVPVAAERLAKAA